MTYSFHSVTENIRRYHLKFDLQIILEFIICCILGSWQIVQSLHFSSLKNNKTTNFFSIILESTVPCKENSTELNWMIKNILFYNRYYFSTFQVLDHNSINQTHLNLSMYTNITPSRCSVWQEEQIGNMTLSYNIQHEQIC